MARKEGIESWKLSVCGKNFDIKSYNSSKGNVLLPTTKNQSTACIVMIQELNDYILQLSSTYPCTVAACPHRH